MNPRKQDMKRQLFDLIDGIKFGGGNQICIQAEAAHPIPEHGGGSFMIWTSFAASGP